jgi:hypothetical protein
LVAGHREPVEIRILSAQGKSETSLPIAVSMASARIASGLGNDRHNVSPKSHPDRLRKTGQRDRKRRDTEQHPDAVG